MNFGAARIVIFLRASLDADASIEKAAISEQWSETRIIAENFAPNGCLLRLWENCCQEKKNKVKAWGRKPPFAAEKEESLCRRKRFRRVFIRLLF